MNLNKKIGLTHTTALIAVCTALAPAASANERFFTYSYEPETMPQGAFEVEQWVTLRALHLTHATEWEHHFDEKEGEVEISAGLTRMIGKHWAVGLEARDHNELPEYSIWENSALYIGPVVNYHRGNWWGTLTVMPQIWG